MINEKILVALLPKLHKKAAELMALGQLNDRFIILADIRDYFMWQVVKCENKNEARELVLKFQDYAGINDEFYRGFFFALSQILSLKFGIALLPAEQIDYDSFKESFKETLRYTNCCLKPSNWFKEN